MGCNNSIFAKLPLFGLYGWPIARVRAPLSGSILLAGILIKLGVVGLIRFAPVINSRDDMRIIVGALSVTGYLTVAGACVVSREIGGIITYSFFVHMVVVVKITTISTSYAPWTCMFMTWAHAIKRTSIFIIVELITKQSRIKHTLFRTGVFKSNPVLRFYRFILVISRCRLPPLDSLVKRIFTFSFSVKYIYLNREIFALVRFRVLYIGYFYLLLWVFSRKG